MANLSGGKVIWYLDADSSSLDKTLGAVESQVKSFSDKQAASFKTFAAAIGVAGVAVGVIVKQSLDASAKMENALVGLSSVAGAFGQNLDDATTAAKNLAKDGLITVQESADSLKNLLATGFSLPEAIQLMNTFKDAAAFNRQGTLGFGEAIVGATQGIKNQNSVLVDNVGITKNLSVILKEAGLSVNDLQNVTSDASVRQKLYNGLLKEGSVFTGDAAKAAKTLGGVNAQLSTTIFNVKAAIGDVLRLAYIPLGQKINDIVSTNPKLVAAFAISAGAAVAFAAAVVGLAGAIGLAITIIGGPFTVALALVSAVMGGLVFGAVRKVQEQIGDTSKAFTSGSREMAAAAQNNMGGAASKAAEKLADKLADIDDQIKKSNVTFKEQLAEMVKASQDRVTSIKGQIDSENKDFSQSTEDRKQEFERSQQDQAQAHQERVDSITKQIDQETNKGIAASATKLADLQSQLNQENADYTEHFNRLKQDYDTDTQRATDAHTAKLKELQDELDAELTLEKNHADDIASVKDFQFRDEIQKLKDSHAEQLVEFEKQKQDAIKNSQDTTAGIASSFNSLPSQIDSGIFSGLGTNLGTDMGTAFKDALISSIRDAFIGVGKSIEVAIQDIKSRAAKNLNLDTVKDAILRTPSDIAGFFKDLFRASGGPINAGQPYIVGEKGPELIVPNSSGTVIPNSQIPTTGGSKNYSFNITVNGNFMGDRLAIRQLTEQIMAEHQRISAAAGA